MEPCFPSNEMNNETAKYQYGQEDERQFFQIFHCICLLMQFKFNSK